MTGARTRKRTEAHGVAVQQEAELTPEQQELRKQRRLVIAERDRELRVAAAARALVLTLGRSIAVLLLLCGAAGAADHGHLWGDRTCGAWESVGPCRSRQCYRRCTVGGCPQILVDGDTVCSAAPGAMPVGIWGPRPGHGGGTGECPPHDWGGESCGPWAEVKPGCKWRHCTRQCGKCGTNGRDREDTSPPGCF